MRDGRFVVAGTDQFADPRNGLTGTGSRFAVARYNANGTLDKTFGTGGEVTTDFGDALDSAAAVLVTPGGTVYVAGSAGLNSGNPFAGNRFALARYTPSGQLDRSFNHGTGLVTTGFPFDVPDNVGVNSCQADVVSLGPDGKVTLGGTALLRARTSRASTTSPWRTTTPTDRPIPISARAGSCSGGQPGQRRLPVSSRRCPAAGTSTPTPPRSPALTPTAHPSPPPWPPTSAPSSPPAAPVPSGSRAGGKILVVGSRPPSNNLGNEAPDIAVVMRLKADGSPDPTFNPGGGYALTPEFSARAEALSPDGHILVAGSGLLPNNPLPSLGLVRYTADGRPTRPSAAGRAA